MGNAASSDAGSSRQKPKRPPPGPALSAAEKGARSGQGEGTVSTVGSGINEGDSIFSHAFVTCKLCAFVRRQMTSTQSVINVNFGLGSRSV